MGSSVHGIFQERILEWVAISYTRDLPDPGIELASFASPALAGGFFTPSSTWEAPRIPQRDQPRVTVSCGLLSSPQACLQTETLLRAGWGYVEKSWAERP